MSQRLAVLGLGYVGLPLVIEAVRSGVPTIGFDVSSAVVDGLNAGKSHVDDVRDEDIAEALAAGFTATSDAELLRGVDVAVICVPTPLGNDRGPDLRAVIAATNTIAGILEPGMLVVLESTTYPGTTDEVVRPILESTGLSALDDFDLAFSPERVDPGNREYGVKNTPKVVGGLTDPSTKRAAAFYSQFVNEVVPAKGAKEAELAKLLENTYRHVNIALANELARVCHELDIDIWNVIELAKSKPFGFQAFYPGPGVGGHCIPIDPNYLSSNVRTRLGYPLRFVELAEEINSTMPTYVARRAQDLLNSAGLPMQHARVLLLGVTYKPNIADQRHSPAAPLAEALMRAGAHIEFHDPRVDRWSVAGQTLTCIKELKTSVEDADLVILVQNHQEYDIDELTEIAQRFFDTKGVTTGDRAHRL